MEFIDQRLSILAGCGKNGENYERISPCKKVINATKLQEIRKSLLRFFQPLFSTIFFLVFFPFSRINKNFWSQVARSAMK